MWRYCQQIVKIWKIKNKIGDIASNGPTTRIQNEQQQVIKQVNKSQTKKNNQTLDWINNKSWDKWSDMKAVELIFTRYDSLVVVVCLLFGCSVIIEFYFWLHRIQLWFRFVSVDNFTLGFTCKHSMLTRNKW